MGGHFKAIGQFPSTPKTCFTSKQIYTRPVAASWPAMMSADPGEWKALATKHFAHEERFRGRKQERVSDSGTRIGRGPKFTRF